MESAGGGRCCILSFLFPPRLRGLNSFFSSFGCKIHVPTKSEQVACLGQMKYRELALRWSETMIVSSLCLELYIVYLTRGPAVLNSGRRDGFEPTFVELEPNRTSKSRTRVEPNFRCRTRTESSRVELSNFLYKWCQKWQFWRIFLCNFFPENLFPKKNWIFLKQFKIWCFLSKF